MSKPKVFAKYVGDGINFVPGIPSRNLTEEEWERCDPAAQILSLKCGIHELVDDEDENENTSVEMDDESEVIEDA